MKKGNITQLRGSLLELFDETKQQNVTIRSARTMTQIAESIIESAKVEVQYRKHMNDNTPIPFLESK